MSHQDFKYIIIGDQGVGKSSLMVRFTNKSAHPMQDPTIGADLGDRTVSIHGQAIRIHVWDSAGQETFMAIMRSYYRGAVAALLVYDITRRETFISLARWLDEARQHANPKMLVMLVGNKIDLAHQRIVSRAEGEQFAKDNGLLFIETSAKTDENVEEAFVKTGAKILQNIEEGVLVFNEPHGIKIGYPEGPSGARDGIGHTTGCSS